MHMSIGIGFIVSPDRSVSEHAGGARDDEDACMERGRISRRRGSGGAVHDAHAPDSLRDEGARFVCRPTPSALRRCWHGVRVLMASTIFLPFPGSHIRGGA